MSDAVERAAGPQPLWALVPPGARARYLRRAAQAILDEVDDLAVTLAREAGIPRTEALLAELLPSVAGLGELADDGPPVLVDRRLGRRFRVRFGRRAMLFQAPVGVVGIRGGEGSPWAEPVTEAGAALLAGNGVVFAPAVPAVGIRLAPLLARCGLPGGLLQIAGREGDLSACDRVVGTGLVGAKGAMLVLEGARLDRTVSGALWAAFSHGGRGTASVGRIVAVPEVTDALLTDLEAGARRLKVGDPLDPETEVGPLGSPEQVAAVEELVCDAEARGAVRLCGGPLTGALCAPVVLRAVPPDARVLREPVPGPVLAVVEAGSEADAIELARPRRQSASLPAGSAEAGEDAAPVAGGWAGERLPAISVWTRDTERGERVARTLGAELTWVNEHGIAAPAAPVRLARHTAPRQVASQRTRLRSARWLPYDPSLVRASETAARLLHGRESERASTLRHGGPALARVALRTAREALGR